MPDEIQAFLRREELERDRDELDHLVEAARSRRAEKRFQLGKGEFDRIEIRTVGRQKPQPRTDPLDRRLHLGLLVHRQVIKDHDVARAQRRREHLLDVGEEGGVVDGPVEHGRGVQAVDAQRRDDGVGLPVAARRVVAEAQATGTAPITTQDVRGNAGLIDEDIAPRVVYGLDVSPVPSRRGDIRTPLFVGVYRFF